jgi:succinyl-CoA synthetase beta subunit
MSALAQFIGLHCGRPASRPTPRPISPTNGHHLTGYESLQYLAARGVPIAPTEIAHSEDGAVAAAERIGYPVSLKADARGLMHRTELGAVQLDLRTESDVRRSWRTLAAIPLWKSEPISVMVQAMVRGGVEIFVGGVRDEQFGPVVLAGAGGIIAEFVHDIGVGLAPLGAEEAWQVIDSTRVSQLLGGWRGAPPADRPALTEALAAISRVTADPDVEALDANPLMALPSGAVLVDAKLIKKGLA